MRATDNSLWHIWQTSAGGAWSAWSGLAGGIAEDPAVVRNADGQLEVFARGGDNALWHIWQTSAGCACSAARWASRILPGTNAAAGFSPALRFAISE